VFAPVTPNHSRPGRHHPPENQNNQAATAPVARTDDRACYFFAYGPWAKDGELIEAFYQLGLKAFNEDRTMIEAQQRNINMAGNDKMLTTSFDGAPLQFRRMMDELIRAEARNDAAANASSAR